MSDKVARMFDGQYTKRDIPNESKTFIKIAEDMAFAILDKPYDMQNEMIHVIIDTVSKRRNESIKYLKDQLSDITYQIENLEKIQSDL